ncbi:MAG: biotin--[acetyl-CoA-carboxylase] ligase [Candidatus Syntrophosphaera sp.]|nr:biotin--[acetyl-CoA-carboxylase] ligase [Candidatus Syntrophosphaera sp.]
MRTELFYDRLDSTNLEHARLLASGAKTDRWVIRSGEQTAGMGRNGNAWLSPRGGLYLSFDLLCPLTVPSFALYVGFCLHSLLLRLFPLQDLSIKWPNDIYLDGAKLAGILCQHKPEESRYLIGIGINTNTSRDDVILEERMAILPESMGFAISNSILAKLLVASVEAEVSKLEQPQSYLIHCDGHLYGKGALAEVSAPQAELKGRIEGIGTDGSLLLRTASGESVAVLHGSLRILS